MKVKQLVFILLTGICLLSASCSNKETIPERPNILFIIADDQAPQTLKVYGNEVCQTPNLDRLAAEGMVLDAAHHMGSWSGAVCKPSRAMIQTSFNVWRTIEPTTGVPNIKEETYVHEPGKWMASMKEGDAEYYSMPAVFNRADYSTFRTCKIGNSMERANRLYQGRSDASKRNDVEVSWWHGEQVMNYLKNREAAADQDPFMIFFGFTHPHDPRYGKSELLEKYGAVNEFDDTIPNPKAPPLQENWLPAHPFHHGHPGLRDEERVQGVMLKRDEATIRNELGREYACIEYIDRQIGVVLDKLEEMGELDNTYIFYTADHGIAVGRHGLAGKQNLYEHTWRVPFIVKGPGIEPGSRAPGNIYLMDVLPTMCDMAGIEKAACMDGSSFLPVLMGEQESVRDVMYGVYSGGTKPGMRSVKKGPWKLIKYDVMDGEVRETQLFNLEDNPDEFLEQHHDPAVVSRTGVQPGPAQYNLASDPAYADKLKEMEALLLDEMIKWGDPYRLWDQPVDKPSNH